MRILAIDPGVNTGWSSWLQTTDHLGQLCQEWALQDFGLNDPPLKWREYHDLTIIEKPMIYPHGGENPNDLITLAIQVGEYKANASGRIHLAVPHDWKGSVKKSVTEARVRRLLSKSQEQRLDSYSKTLRHNVIDAIGIGHWATKEYQHWT